MRPAIAMALALFFAITAFSLGLTLDQEILHINNNYVAQAILS